MYLENCISNLYKRLPIWELFSFVPESPSFLTKKVGKSVLFAAGSCLSRVPFRNRCLVRGISLLLQTESRHAEPSRTPHRLP